MRTEFVYTNRRGPARPLTRSWPPRRSTSWIDPSGEGPSGAVRPHRNLYTVVLTDVAMSARFDAQGQRRMRTDLYDLVRGVVEYGGSALETLPLTDVGDGLRLMIPLNRIGPTHVVDMFILGLSAGLREHRRCTGDVNRIRLRVAFDLGVIEPHLRGWAGEPLVSVARLVDAPPAREALRSDLGLDLVAVVSDLVYQSAIRDGYGYVGPGCFRGIRVRVKQFDARAWLLARGATAVCGSCHRAAA